MNVSNYVGLVSSWSRRSRTIVSSHLRGSQFSSRGYFLSGKFFSWVFLGLESFSRGYFVSPIIFLMGILWVQNFSCGYFVGQRYFLVGTLWVQIFSPK